jgi:hypothetical protein
LMSISPHLQPLFPGESGVDQLVEIIKVLCTLIFFILRWLYNL